MYRRIVVGTDGSQTADQLLDVAGGLASLMAASIYVVAAYKPARVAVLAGGGPCQPRFGEEERLAAKAILEHATARLASRSPRVIVRRLRCPRSHAWLLVHRASRSGERRALNVIEEPGSFGEIALLDQRPRSATVEALEPCELFAVSREAFLGLLGRDPRLVDGVLRELGRMVRRLSDQLADDSLLDLPTRVAKTLLRLVDAQVDGAAQPAVALSKTKLAELAGGSRQSVNAALSTLSSRAMPDGHGGSRPASRPGASRRRITPQISDPLRRCGSGCQHSALPSIDGAVPRRRRP